MNRLKELRNERNLSLRQLEKLIGINYSTIACYETGKREPNIETLKKLASFYEVSIDYLCDYDGYIYCLYENADYKLSLSKKSYPEFKKYIYFNKDNNRCINLNKCLNINSDKNIIDLLSEFYKIHKVDLLFEKENISSKDIDNLDSENIILSVSFINKVKEILNI